MSRNRRIILAALLALSLGLSASVLLGGFSYLTIVRLLQTLALVTLIALIIFIIMSLIGFKMADWSTYRSEEEFEQAVIRSEQLAQAAAIDPPSQEMLLDPMDDADFEQFVALALDRLPNDFQQVLEDNVAVLVSDDGASHGAYGLYQGGTLARQLTSNKVIIFRDTLRRDFGHDPQLLVGQINRVVLHEVAHHLGFDENGVRRLGL